MIYAAAWIACGIAALAIRYFGYHRIQLVELLVILVAGPVALFVLAWTAVTESDLSIQRKRK